VPVEALAWLNALNAPLRRLAVVPIISALELLSFVRARATNNVASTNRQSAGSTKSRCPRASKEQVTSNSALRPAVAK